MRRGQDNHTVFCFLPVWWWVCLSSDGQNRLFFFHGVILCSNIKTILIWLCMVRWDWNVTGGYVGTVCYLATMAPCFLSARLYNSQLHQRFAPTSHVADVVTCWLAPDSCFVQCVGARQKVLTQKKCRLSKIFRCTCSKQSSLQIHERFRTLFSIPDGGKNAEDMLSREKLDKISARFETYPRKSLARVAQQTGVSALQAWITKRCYIFMRSARQILTHERKAQNLDLFAYVKNSHNF